MSQSTAVVMSGRSVHQTTFFFLGKLDYAVNQYFVHIFLPVTDNNHSRISKRDENGHRNYFMINLHASMGTAWIKLVTPGSAVGLVTNCAVGPC